MTTKRRNGSDEGPIATWSQITGPLREEWREIRRLSLLGKAIRCSPLLQAIHVAAPQDARASAAMEVIKGVFSLDQYKAFVNEGQIKVAKPSRLLVLAADFERIASGLMEWRKAKGEADAPSRRKEKLEAVANAAATLVERLKGLDTWHVWSIVQAGRAVQRMHEDAGVIVSGTVRLQANGVNEPVNAVRIFNFLTDPFPIEALRQAALLAPEYTYPIPNPDVAAVRRLAEVSGLELKRYQPLIRLAGCFFLEVAKLDDPYAEEFADRRIDELIDMAKKSP